MIAKSVGFDLEAGMKGRGLGLTLQAILSNGALLSGRPLAGCSTEWLLRGRRNAQACAKACLQQLGDYNSFIQGRE
jgi:hypothetical protein